MSEIRTVEELAALPAESVLFDGENTWLATAGQTTRWYDGIGRVTDEWLVNYRGPLRLLYRSDLPSQADLRAAVDAALALHVPVKRYHDGSGEWSTSTPEGAADYAEIELSEVEFFEVCGHCGYMETWMHDEAEQDFDYREALWPCATARALAPVADPSPHTTSDEETT